MEEFRKILTIDNRVYSTKILLLLILMAYIFSIAVRWIWVGYAEGIPQFIWNGQIMINTNDGYAWAEGARDILAGGHQAHDGSFVDWPASQLTAFLAKILPVSFETLILYLPAFLGSLLVVPVVLIGRLLKNDLLGFIAGLIAGIAWSYYNRTMIGYYDTDMLSIVLPAFLLWSVMFAIVHKSDKYLILATVMILLYQWWYPQAYSLNMAMVFVVFIYTLIFDNKNFFNYKLIIFIFIGMLSIPIYIKLSLAMVLFGFFYNYKEKANNFIIPILLFVLFLMLLTGGLTPILSQLQGYLFREAVAGDISSLNFHYYSVVKTVREAGQIPFETFANRISGHTVIFILSTIGYILLSLRYKIMWLALPMIGLGFLALKGGLRFTVYAVPINALGMAFIILLIAQYVKEKVFKYGVIVLLTVAVLIPNINHVTDYKVPTVFKNKDVAILDKLKGIASREDYVIAWWDYGYPIRYYADVKTLIDDARHSGGANYPVSFALLNEPVAASNFIRTTIEYMEIGYKNERNVSTMKAIMKDYNFNRVSKLLSELKSKSFKTPEKTQDIYFYLPLQMMNIFPTIDLFSNMNIETGKEYRRGMFYMAQAISNNNGVITLNNGIKIKDNSLYVGSQRVPINQFIVTEYNAKGVLQKQTQRLNIGASAYVIYMKSYNRFLILDKRLFNSLYIQLFVLENYDSTLFEPTILSPMTKIYKLKK